MGWTLLFMLVILKIPLAAALYLIWWAVKEDPVTDGEGPGSGDRHPRRKPPSFPRSPRRGPAGGGAACRPASCPQVGERSLPAPAIARR